MNNLKIYYSLSILTGQAPAVPPLIFAPDLSIVVPNTALAGILLWQRKPWGYVLAALMLVKAAIYGLVLVAGTALIALRGLAPWYPLLPLYIFVAAGGALCLFVLLKNLNYTHS